MVTPVYAYFVTVACKKRYGGTVHAENMDDAARKAAKICKLTIKRHEPFVRPWDGDVIQQADWMLDGKRACLAVWASADYF